jgi:hypothetical protein
LQLKVHALSLHAGVPLPFVGAGQPWLHEPQLFASPVKSTQAVGDCVGHAVSVLLHVNPHTLFTHAGCPPVTPLHALPHVLQFFASSVRFVHVLPQRSGVGELQPLTQPVAPHTEVLPLHTVLQPPQWEGCVMSTSQPSPGWPLQSAQPVEHADAGKAHAPACVQDVVPETCGRLVHEWPQVPQLCTSSGTHAPPQSSWPVGQVAPVSTAPLSTPPLLEPLPEPLLEPLPEPLPSGPVVPLEPPPSPGDMASRPEGESAGWEPSPGPMMMPVSSLEPSEPASSPPGLPSWNASPHAATRRATIAAVHVRPFRDCFRMKAPFSLASLGRRGAAS